jgi:hypothetical protein
LTLAAYKAKCGLIKKEDRIENATAISEHVALEFISYKKRT